MAFPFFKKTEEKMSAPKMVRPNAPASSSGGAASQLPKDALDDDLESLDFTGIQLEEEKDPIVAQVEEAAIAYANDDLTHAEALLKDGIKLFASLPEVETLWLMLFDLYRVSGQREPFTAIELEYAKRFEKQPPVWITKTAQPGAVAAAAGATPFKGDLVAGNLSAVEVLAQAVEKSDKPRFDLSKVKAVDAAAAQRLLDVLTRARTKLKKQVDLLGLDAIVKLVDPMIKDGNKDEAIWKLLLECYQRQAKQEAFEELALEFAMTFELSPPDYQPPPATKKPATGAAAPAAEKPADDAFPLAGDMRGGAKIDGLEDFLQSHAQPVVDMSAVSRVDFACAGVLFTALQAPLQRGARVTIRYPNHLVAALLKVVGVADVATIVHAKT